jgi:hypothetical protein
VRPVRENGHRTSQVESGLDVGDSRAVHGTTIFFLALVLEVGACSRPHSPGNIAALESEASIASDGAQTLSRCEARLPVKAEVVGSWLGSVTDEATPPALVVEVVDPNSGSRTSREIVRLPAAVPFFATDWDPKDLCSDDGSTSEQVSVRCIVGRGIVSHVLVSNNGNTLDVRVDDAPAHHWQMPAFEHACFDLHGYDARRDLEPIRASWGRETASARCQGVPTRPPARVVFDLQPQRGKSEQGTKAYHCTGGTTGPTGAASVWLSVASIGLRNEVGVLSNLCGGLHVTRYDDADAIMLTTSDMGIERRFAYRLGDRLYLLSGDGRITGIELPCGAHATFDVRSPGHEALVETAKIASN